MTDSARDERWSEWIPWEGGECPVEDMRCIEYRMRRHGTAYSHNPTELRWTNEGEWSDIIAYRYKIKEPESDMHPDLEWLARNVSEWGFKDHKYIQHSGKTDKGTQTTTYSNKRCLNSFTKAQWLQARKDLGLIMSDEEEEIAATDWTPEAIKAAAFSTPEEEEAWQDKERELIGGPRTAENFLHEAANLMTERGKQYDQPDGERSMGKAVTALNAITGRDLTEAEGWLLMSLVKRARQHSGAGYHKDSAEDAVAYAALEAEALESGR